MNACNAEIGVFRTVTKSARLACVRKVTSAVLAASGTREMIGKAAPKLKRPPKKVCESLELFAKEVMPVARRLQPRPER